MFPHLDVCLFIPDLIVILVRSKPGCRFLLISPFRYSADTDQPRSQNEVNMRNACTPVLYSGATVQIRPGTMSPQEVLMN
jgi:hypothetical protein